MRTVYLGTSAFAATVLRALAGTRHRPQLVVTPPDRPRGRGRQVSATPVAIAAQALGLEVAKAESVNKGPVPERVLALEPDLGLVCAFGQLIGEPLLSDLPMLNVHPSALPRWRGAAPVERAIMAGDEQTAVSVMRVTAGLDAGPVANAELVAIGTQETYGEIEPRLAEVGARLLIEACDAWQAGTIKFTEQQEDGVTYAEKITGADRRLDPSRTATELVRTVRALTPHIGAYLETGAGDRLGVEAASALDQGPDAGRVAVESRRLVVGCGEGGLELEVVKPPGKAAMPIADYLRGNEPPDSFS